MGKGDIQGGKGLRVLEKLIAREFYLFSGGKFFYCPVTIFETLKNTLR
jgi:hypothetical protein